MKRSSTKEKEVATARRSEVLKRIATDLQYFSLQSAWNDHVVFRYAGRSIRFEYYEGRVVRMGGDQAYLSEVDYREMFALAKVIMSAVEQALKDRRKQKAARDTASQPSPQTPLLFSYLPVHINPKTTRKKVRS